MLINILFKEFFFFTIFQLFFKKISVLMNEIFVKYLLYKTGHNNDIINRKK